MQIIHLSGVAPSPQSGMGRVSYYWKIALEAAGSVVTKDVSDYAIVGGNPAKEIRKRFTEQQILNLKRIAWWNWPVQKIKDQVTLLSSVNIDQFIANHLNDA